MIKNWLITALVLILATSCITKRYERDILPDVPRGYEALTVTGVPLKATEPTPSAVEKLAVAKAEWKADETNADKLIWYGRWLAYNGRYRDAIKIFSRGQYEHIEDMRMQRHLGHRYITIREFDRALGELEYAALHVSGAPDQVEPDGMPNAMNIPVSTLNSNIFYHLGLAHYLKGNLEEALQAWTSDLSLAVNDDMKVATLHWVYMTLRELGRPQEAFDALSEVTAEMNIIENMAYQKLCLFYKGEITIEELTGGAYSAIMNDAMLYGIGNWYLYNNSDTETAKEYFNKIFIGGAWASFGYIAAEVKAAGL